MQSPETPTDVTSLIMQFMMNDMAKVQDEAVRTRLMTLLTNPDSYSQIVKSANFIYLIKEQATAGMLELATGLFYFANKQGFSELWKDNRGVLIIEALRRQLGETPAPGTSWPDPEADPTPVPDFGPGGWSEPGTSPPPPPASVPAAPVAPAASS